MPWEGSCNVRPRSEIAEVQEKVRLYMAVGRFDAAEKLLKATLADLGSQAVTENLLGWVYHRQSRFQEAMKHFQLAVQADPRYVEAALNLAVTLCDLSRYDEARQMFLKVAEEGSKGSKGPPSMLAEKIAEQHAVCAFLYDQAGMSHEAVQEYRKALTVSGRLSDARLALAKLYLRTEQFDRALAELQTLVNASPELDEASTWLGVVHYKQGNIESARQLLERTRKINPNNQIARAFLKVMGSRGVAASPRK